MPKIIEGAKESILHCTRKHLSETGYTSLSLRLIARECHLGVGTIYNYFSSKDDLVAQIMLEAGCWTAVNLDGGGSSTMVFNGQLVNKPTTTGKIKERSVSDIVCISL